MDGDNALNVQNAFFNQIRKDRARVTVSLNSGHRISGVIKSFDKFTFLLDTRHGEQIVFKHAVATVSIQRHADALGRSEHHADERQERKGFGNFMKLEEGKKE